MHKRTGSDAIKDRINRQQHLAVAPLTQRMRPALRQAAAKAPAQGMTRRHPPPTRLHRTRRLTLPKRYPGRAFAARARARERGPKRPHPWSNRRAGGAGAGRRAGSALARKRHKQAACGDETWPTTAAQKPGPVNTARGGQTQAPWRANGHGGRLARPKSEAGHHGAAAPSCFGCGSCRCGSCRRRGCSCCRSCGCAGWAAGCCRRCHHQVPPASPAAGRTPAADQRARPPPLRRQPPSPACARTTTRWAAGA